MTKGEKFNVISNIVLIAIVAVYIFLPGGPAADGFAAWKERRAVEDLTVQAWPSLTSTAMSVVGDAAADMLIEFGDYYCPACRIAHDSISTNAGWTRPVGFVHYPLPIHRHADLAARIAICGDRIGRGAEVHELLMQTPMTDPPDLAAIARRIEVDPVSLELCVSEAETAEILAKHTALAERLAVRATPTFVSRGERILGVAAVSELHNLGLR